MINLGKLLISVAERFPELIEEWDFSKNGIDTPFNVSFGAHKRVWWKCIEGHTWQAKVYNRCSNKTGCPYCSGFITAPENSIAVTNPELMEEWDYEKNSLLGLKPENVSRSSDKKVWWICKNDNSHSWETQVKVRTRGNGCPYCSGRFATRETSLEVRYPSIASEFHPTKNGTLAPESILPKSAKKVWWICKNGHEWEATVSNRVQGKGCPYCSNRIILKENSLGEKFPEIARQWHYAKNGKETPLDIAPSAGKSVWWICEKGHEWKVAVYNRTKDSSSGSCPYCIGRKVCGDNCLANVRPDIAKEWHPTLNGKHTPFDFTIGSSQKVWWRCDKGHEWRTSISNRTNKDNQTGCPNCNFEIGTSFPEQAIYYYLSQVFDRIYNKYKITSLGKLEADIYIKDLNLIIEYDGYNYHRGEDSIKRDERKNKLLYENKYNLIRIREQGSKELKLPKIEMYGFNFIEYEPNRGYENLDLCINQIVDMITDKFNISDKFPMDYGKLVVDIPNDKLDIISKFKNENENNSIAKLLPEIAAQWNYDKNNGLKPEQFTVFSNIKVWWKCDKGHEYEAVIGTRTRSGCPYCSGKKTNHENCLETLRPELAKQWNYEKNGALTPQNVTKGSGKKVWWKCSKGHEWQAAICHRARNSGCPYCSGYYFLEERSLLNMRPDVAKEWNYEKNNDTSPDKISVGSPLKVWWKCSKGHEWQTTVNLRTNQNTKCPYCSNQKICKDNCLSTLRPDLLKEWDYKKNIDLNPDDIGTSNPKKVSWICSKCGFTWESLIRSRAKFNSGCPRCAGRIHS